MIKKTYELNMDMRPAVSQYQQGILLKTGFFARSIEKPFRPLLELHLLESGVSLPHQLMFLEANGRLYIDSMEVGEVVTGHDGGRPCLTLNDKGYAVFNAYNEGCDRMLSPPPRKPVSRAVDPHLYVDDAVAAIPTGVVS